MTYAMTREKHSPAALAVYMVIASVALLFTVYEIKAITSETAIHFSDARGAQYVLGNCAEGNDMSGLCGKRISSLGN